MRFMWHDYINNQLAWWSSLSKLATDPTVTQQKELAAAARLALANAQTLPEIRRPKS